MCAQQSIHGASTQSFRWRHIKTQIEIKQNENTKNKSADVWFLRLAAVLCAHKISWIFKRINFGRRAETYEFQTEKSQKHLGNGCDSQIKKPWKIKTPVSIAPLGWQCSPHGICNNKNRNSMPHIPRLRFAECNLAAMLRVYIHTCPWSHRSFLTA